MDVARLKKDVQAGVVGSDALLALVLEQRQTIRRLERRVEQLEGRLALYEPVPPPDGGPQDEAGTSSTNYSLAAEEKRRRRPQSREEVGRKPGADKLAEAVRMEDVYPQGAAAEECVLARTRVAWRIENGLAVRVGYRVHKRVFRNDAPPVPGLLPRGEFGIEIVVLIAFLVYVIRVSLDQACLLLGFFCRLPIRKSQANALLDQLSRHWQAEFDALCELVARSAVVYLDETGWKINTQGCSLWAVQSKLHTVLRFGCRKDAKTLAELLPPEVFRGTAVSDDAAVYGYGKFSSAQKCWAHLLRKAIRLTLLYPERPAYQTFLTGLLTLYRAAKRAQADGRLGEAGRRARVGQFETQLWEVCTPHQRIWESPRSPAEREFSNLVYELFRLVEAEELFTFVRLPDVEPTNNLSERTLRGPALDRKAARTSKTDSGAHRRSVISSVLESLRKNLTTFTLHSVVETAASWLARGTSLFRTQLAEIQQRLSLADTS